MGSATLKVVPRPSRLRSLIDRINPACELEVDGGIDRHTALESLRAGATVFVAGTSIFGAPEGPEAALRGLREVLGAT